MDISTASFWHRPRNSAKGSTPALYLYMLYIGGYIYRRIYAPQYTALATFHLVSYVMYFTHKVKVVAPVRKMHPQLQAYCCLNKPCRRSMRKTCCQLLQAPEDKLSLSGTYVGCATQFTGRLFQTGWLKQLRKSAPVHTSTWPGCALGCIAHRRLHVIKTRCHACPACHWLIAWPEPAQLVSR